MDRIYCVLCESNKLVDIYTFTEYPFTPSSSDNTDYKFKDIRVASCIDCSCVQFRTLIDPVVLYENSHNSTESTPTWKEHHKQFAQFILQERPESVLEIGGNSGLLYETMRANNIPYTILDICDNSRRSRDIPFIQGNCESFDYNGYPSVVLSHTFEHLYNPRRFIETLRQSNVSSVFISIPNMKHLVESNNISVVNTEHTFYIDTSRLITLFSEFSYDCNCVFYFRNHSVFYHFVPKTSASILGIFLKYENIFNNIVIDKPCFICPGGHYGQKIYYYLKRYKHFIKGFIDNDTSKQNQTVYGTSAMVYSPDILKTYQGNICILLYAGPYTDELRAQLNSLHSSIEFIDIFNHSTLPLDELGKGVTS